MDRLELFRRLFKIGIFVTVSLHFSIGSNAQQQRKFYPHDVVEIGNGTKIEVLTSRGEGANEEWDVIYYTDKRQLGKRKWETTSNIIELEKAAKLAAQKANLERIAATRSAANSKTGSSKAPVKAEVKRKDTTKTESPVAIKSNNNIKNTEQAKKSSPAVTPAQKQIEKPGNTTNTSASIPANSTEAVTKANNLLDSASRNKTVIVEEKGFNIDLTNKSKGTPKKLSLETCFQLARDKNIGLKTAQNVINSTLIDQSIARNRYLPSVSYNLGHYFYFGRNIDPVTNVFVQESFSGGYTSLGMQLDLFAGFTRINAVKQSTYNSEAASYAKKRAELELLTNITLTYARLLYSKEQLAVERNNIEGTLKELETVNEKIKVGRLSKYEAYTFNGRLKSQEADFATILHDSVVANQDLKQLLNIPYQEEIDIAPIDTTTLTAINETNFATAEFVETILNQHPLIKQAQMQEQAARVAEKIAKGSFYPSLSVGGSLASNYNGSQTNINGGKVSVASQLNDNLGQNININLRVPIFSRMESANRVKKERINIYNSRLALEDATNTITTNTIQLLNDFNSAKTKYLTSRSSWEQNSLSYNLYQEKYKLGQINSMELLMAQNTLNTSTLQYLQARLQLFFQYRLLEILKEA